MLDIGVVGLRARGVPEGMLGVSRTRTSVSAVVSERVVNMRLILSTIEEICEFQMRQFNRLRKHFSLFFFFLSTLSRSSEITLSFWKFQLRAVIDIAITIC